MRFSRRGGVALAILLAWAAGLGLLARRELFRPESERLAEAALRITPGAMFYAVRQGAEQIGFASSTIDTVDAGIAVTDYFVADLPVGGKLRRASAQSSVKLTRRLSLTEFTLSVNAESGPLRVSGRPSGDTVLVLAIAAGGDRPDTQRVKIDGPVMLPTLLPLTIALGETPRVGKRYRFSTFDPTALGVRPVTVRVAAESVFVVTDSAVFDSVGRIWKGARRDTVRAWHVVPDQGTASVLAAWVDAQGRVVEAAQPGNLRLSRMAYELAFENWRTQSRRRTREVDADQDILESTAIAANAPLGRRPLDTLVVRLANVDLAGFELAGDRQTLRGDTLAVARERVDALRPGYTLPGGREHRQRFRADLAAEPLIQSASWPIVSLAIRIAGPDKDPRVVAEKLNRWVHDSLEKEITVGIPSALQVLEARSGDCNEHAALYVALARALGLPSRVAAGLAYVNGKFYYHAWPEVYLDRWVAVDPTFGQFPADAAHLRFVTGGLSRQAELLRLIGALEIDVVRAR